MTMATEEWDKRDYVLVDDRGVPVRKIPLSLSGNDEETMAEIRELLGNAVSVRLFDILRDGREVIFLDCFTQDNGAWSFRNFGKLVEVMTVKDGIAV